MGSLFIDTHCISRLIHGRTLLKAVWDYHYPGLNRNQSGIPGAATKRSLELDQSVRLSLSLLGYCPSPEAHQHRSLSRFL